MSGVLQFFRFFLIVQQLHHGSVGGGHAVKSGLVVVQNGNRHSVPTGDHFT